jgi:hypothetical protein
LNSQSKASGKYKHSDSITIAPLCLGLVGKCAATLGAIRYVGLLRIMPRRAGIK